MHGDYRRMFARAENLEVKTCKFEKKDQDLLEPFESLSELAKKQTSGSNFAILLQFSLQKSTYATMLIREFCHISSSFENQELINKTGEDPEAQEDNEDQKVDQEQIEAVEIN